MALRLFASLRRSGWLSSRKRARTGNPATLTLDDDRRVRTDQCVGCGRPYEQVVAFVYRDGDAYAIYHAQCHDHGDGSAPTAWLDIVLGGWEEPDFPDHVTFSVRVDANGAGIVDAPVAVSGTAAYDGRKLQREEAFAHSKIGEVWTVVDFIVVEDPTVSTYVYSRRR